MLYFSRAHGLLMCVNDIQHLVDDNLPVQTILVKLSSETNAYGQNGQDRPQGFQV